MQAKFTDASESKHEVFALTYYVSDSDDNEKERFFPVKRLQIYLANHRYLFGSRFNRGKFIFPISQFIVSNWAVDQNKMTRIHQG